MSREHRIAIIGMVIYFIILIIAGCLTLRKDKITPSERYRRDGTITIEQKLEEIRESFRGK
jgi:hypothetical protein